MKYAVIGSEGFLGKAVSQAISIAGDYLVKIDRIMPTSCDNPQKICCHELDLTNTDKLIEVCLNQEVDVAINLAGTLGQASREEMLELHCSAPLNFIKAAAGYNFKVILVGSAAEYGAVAAGPKVTEDFPLSPISDYGKSKACQTSMVDDFCKINKLPKVILARPFNVLGPGMSEALFLGSFASQVAKIEAGLLPPVLKTGNLDSVRDFLPLKEVVSCFLALAQQGEHGQVYNICSGQLKRIKDILDILLKLATIPIETIVDESRSKSNDLDWMVGDNAKMSSLKRVSYSDEEIVKTVEDTLNWCRDKVKNGK